VALPRLAGLRWITWRGPQGRHLWTEAPGRQAAMNCLTE
jgi:hypothetical protein